jgi:exodeoxyribonuclease V alpha subunit
VANEGNDSLEQTHAIELCADLQIRIVGVTGGAGTGKTRTLGKAFAEVRRQVGRDKVALCAPTGRAAKRIQELTGIPAKTVHRLLEFPTPEDHEEARIEGEPPPENKPKRNRQFPLKERVIFVDEASMLGPTLYQQLMEAMPTNGCIRFFGDNNQLPPVESDGESESPFLKVLNRPDGNVTLTHNYRSDDFIVSNALRILEGRVPIQNERFRIIYDDNPIKRLIHFATKDFMDMDHQIIMPTRRGKYGTIRVNPSLQVKWNGRGPCLLLERHDDGGKEPQADLAVRGQDKFLWTKNDYQLNLFNGEIGQIEWVNDEDGSIGLLTPDRSLVVPPSVRAYSPYHGHAISYDPRKSIELGYAITTHKSQGSEFKTIIYCITGGQSWLLNRKNFYTAVTRAKHMVVLICDRSGMFRSLKKY